MFRDAARYGNDPNIVVRAKRSTFLAPYKWKEPKLVFTCSWSDWFIEEADPWRDDAWEIIRNTPHLTYQILTKRPERILANLPDDWEDGYKNVWMIVSTENQETYDQRMPLLAEVPAVVKGISAEPLVGPITLELGKYPWLQWVITGGESGAADKICAAHPDWFRNMNDECLDAGVALFHKQNGGSKQIDGVWGGNKLDDQVIENYPILV